MAIITGIMKNKAGDTVYMRTSAAQVVVTEGSQNLDAWITSHEATTATLTAIVDEEGKVKSTALPDILNKFKGVFSGEAALPETGEAGDYAICTDTDTVWIWDAEKAGGEGWVDTGNKGSVTSVNGQTGDVVIEIADIDGLQTAIDAKVNTTDIVNNLTSEDTDKPLSAAQGKALSDLVTAAQSTADSANSAASAAQSTADTAVSNAATAQAAAEAAQTTATAAQTAATNAQTTATAAATAAAEIDFAIVENGESAPTNLREAGIYFEKDATVGG